MPRVLQSLIRHWLVHCKGPFSLAKKLFNILNKMFCKILNRRGSLILHKNMYRFNYRDEWASSRDKIWTGPQKFLKLSKKYSTFHKILNTFFLGSISHTFHIFVRIRNLQNNYAKFFSVWGLLKVLKLKNKKKNAWFKMRWNWKKNKRNA